MVTYSDMIQFCIFIVALVGLCYEIFKGKRRQPPTTANSRRLYKQLTIILGQPLAVSLLCLKYSISDKQIQADQKIIIFY